MTQRELEGWRLYWRTEPWGAWRDNLHAAVVAREVRRPQLRKGAGNKLEDFFYRDPVERQADARAQVINLFRMIGTKRRAGEKRRRKKRKGQGRRSKP